MAITLQIKRAGSATANSAPSGNLAAGELAVSYGNAPAHDNAGGRLFVGNSDGSANIQIGGQYFVGILDHAPGTLTASSALIVDSNKAIDDLIVGNNASTGGSIQLKEGTGTGNDRHVQLKAPNSLGGNVSFTLPSADGSAGEFLKTNGSGELSFDSVTTSFTLSDGSNTDTFNTGETLEFAAGEGINTAVTNNTVTFSAEDATDTNKGIASFATADFDVSSGAVTIKASGVSNNQLAGGIANTKLANSSVTIGTSSVSLGGTLTDINGVQQLDVDHIRLDGNTISSTGGTNNIVLDPNSTGTVTVPSGYSSRAGFGSDSLVNKSYVDSVANGLDVKESVRVATTGALPAVTYNNSAGTLTANANGALSIDGVTLSTNDRVLVKDQGGVASHVENGIYKVTSTGGAGSNFVLTRAPDADTAAELTGGTFFFVEEGTSNADNGYVATHNGTPTFNSTQIAFEQFSGAGQISAGNGLTKTGNTIDVVGTTNRISVSANAIDISSSYVGQATITTLGTITTGTWTGTAIAATSGGTGLSSVAKGSVLVANNSNQITDLDGGGNSADGILLYTNASDTISWATSIDGGTF